MNDIRISIKTRIGKDNYEEFYDLLKIYNNYPCEELIIHPRTQKDYYRNKPNKDIYKYAISESSNTLCYNGDIFTLEDYNKLLKYFPEIDNIMLGRGILVNPGLMDEIKFNKELNKNVLKNFHDEILEEYTEFFEHEKGALFKMKELWSYMIYIFSDGKSYLKGIRTSQSLTEYKEVVHKLFQEQEIVKGSGLFNKIE